LYENYLNSTKITSGVNSPIRVEVPNAERLSSIISQVNHRPISSSTPRSPARISLASRNTTSSDHCSTSSIPFEQDDCGTIKRMPCDLMDSTNCSMQKMSLAKNAVAQTYMLRHSSSGSSNSQQGGHNSSSKLSNNMNNDDDDSDEEHFPPPPEVVLQRTPTPQQASIQMFSNRSSFSSPIPPPIQRVNPTFIEKQQQQQMINVTPQNQAIHLSNGNNSNASASSRKAAPPPPPKRSENTRLVTAGPNGDLYTELQKATALQKRRIEGN
jgi:hypothetical protein